MRMKWRDVRFEKPEEKDGNVIVKDAMGREWIIKWDEVGESEMCWMPISELPKPTLPGPIPDGWRPVDKAVEVRESLSKVKAWSRSQQRWFDCNCSGRRDREWGKGFYYITPIEQPVRYRPFADDVEFAPYFNRGVTRATLGYPNTKGACRVDAYGEDGVWIDDDYYTYSQMLSDGRKFSDDGTPFGVKIE